METETEAENQMITFAKVWVTAYVAVVYCYGIGKSVGKGIPRLVCVIPVVFLFLALPLKITSVHLGGNTAFFLAWLANFKLLLFAFGRGPLGGNATDPASLSLHRFVAVACLPIKIDTNTTARKKNSTMRNYALKGLALAAMVGAYDYSEYMGETVLLALYSFHIYLCLEICLAAIAALARACLGVELEPHFDEPYLSTSLQDFWGRRWNLMATRILRPAVYDPVIAASERLVGRDWARAAAVLGTFAVSAVMHELIFYYLGRLRPTWEITQFFVLHGVCVVAEIAAKRSLAGRVAIPRAVSVAMTVGFVMVTGFRLFFPPLLRLRADERAFQEYAAVGAFVRIVASTAFSLGNVNSTGSV